MSRKRRPVGACCICGKVEPLSYEHVPPEKAFNNQPVVSYPWNADIILGPEQEIKVQGKYTTQQRGMGMFTLCEWCNNLTGAWYANSFIEWCYQGMDILIRAEGKPTLHYLHYILPLPILKQIVTMFMSVSGPHLREVQPELEAFVLNRERKYLNPKYRFFLYYNIEGIMRTQASVGILKFDNSRSRTAVLSEITFPPFGYVMTIDDQPHEKRLVEITHFSRYDYNEFAAMPLQLPVLPTHLWFPGDYRTKEEIIKGMQDQPTGTDGP